MTDFWQVCAIPAFILLGALGIWIVQRLRRK